jgi:hypothetical protein
MAESWAARLRIPLLVLVVAAAVYVTTLSFDFVFDDTPQIVQSQPNLTWTRVPVYFKTHVWQYISPYPTNYYRPLFMTWLMLNYQAWGVDPMLWHLSAVLHHLLATLLFFFLARRLLEDDLPAGVAALIFAVHPAHVEAVAWISGVTEPLFAILTFGTLLCYLHWRDETDPARAWKWRAASIGLFAAAIFSKETAIVIPLLVIAFDWILYRGEEGHTGERLRRIFSVAFPFAAVLFVYTALRIHVLHGFAPVKRPWPLADIVFTWPLALAYYIRQLLLPFRYSVFPAMAPVKDPGFLNFSVPVLIVAAAGGGLYWVARRSRTAACAVALLLIPLAPVLNVSAFAFDDFMHDRYLYVPSAGFCILLALGWERLGSRLRIAVLVPAVLLLGIVTVRTSLVWKDNLTLYPRAVELAPDSAIAQAYLGEELLARKRYADALPVLRSALVGFNKGSDLYSDIAECYMAMERYDDALSAVREAIAIMPGNPNYYINLAVIELRKGQLAAAEADARKALQLRRRISALESHYHDTLGIVLRQKGDLRGAVAEFQAELDENPNLDDVRDRLREATSSLQQARP